jgi:hypothetical protein
MAVEGVMKLTDVERMELQRQANVRNGRLIRRATRV